MRYKPVYVFTPMYVDVAENGFRNGFVNFESLTRFPDCIGLDSGAGLIRGGFVEVCFAENLL